MGSSAELTHDQITKLRAHVERERKYLVRLVNRMRELEYVNTDPLLSAAEAALFAYERLSRATLPGASAHGAIKRADPYGPAEDGCRRA